MKTDLVLLFVCSLALGACQAKPAADAVPEPEPIMPSRRELALTEPMMRGSDVSELQQKLASFNIEHANEEPGVFGSMTMLAVKKFEREFGFETDGAVRQAEWKVLFSPGDIMALFLEDIALVNAYSLKDPHWARSIESAISPGPYLQARAICLSDGQALKAAQLAAEEASAGSSIFWGISFIDDRRIYFEFYSNSDNRVYYSVGQKAYAIRDGVAHELILKDPGAEKPAWAMSTASDLATKQSAAAVRNGGPLLSRQLGLAQPRMNGDDVLQLQQKLVAMHFAEIGQADGWYGPMTEETVRKAQYYFGFLPNGVVDERLWRVLFSPDEVFGQLGLDVASINEYVLGNANYDRDFNPGPYGKSELAWFVEGSEVQCATLSVFENGYFFESATTEYDFTKTVRALYPLGDRFLVIEEKYAPATSLEDDSPPIQSTAYYSVGGKAYTIRFGLVMPQEEGEARQMLSWASQLTDKLKPRNAAQ